MPDAAAHGQKKSPVLAVSGLSCGYGASAILRDVSFDIAEAEIFTLLGRNGMGKTTLVRTIMGFLRPMGGSVFVLGQDTSGRDPAHLIRAGVAYAPQEKAIFQDLSIADNLKLAAPSNRACTLLMPGVFDLFPFLADRLRQPAGTLSGGEQKMLIIARALMTKPRLVLLDEVSEGLQPSMVDRLGSIILSARQTLAASILLVEQNIKLAWSVADRWAVLKGGVIAAEGKVSQAALTTAASHLTI